MEHGLIISRNYFSNKQKSLLNTATRRGIIFYDSVAGAYYPSAIDSSQIPLRRTSLQVLTPACEVSHNAVTQDSQQKLKEKNTLLERTKANHVITVDERKRCLDTDNRRGCAVFRQGLCSI